MLENSRRRSPSSSNLLEIIAHARRRWRYKLLMRGALTVAGIACVLLLVAAYGLDWARFSREAIILARVTLGAALLGAIVWFLVRPMRRKVTDEQVALYLEEHEPTLQSTLVSAVEASRTGEPQSAALVQRVVEQAVERCTELDATRRLERLPLRRYGTALAALAVIALLAVTW
jgi:hypothetical protein